MLSPLPRGRSSLMTTYLQDLQSSSMFGSVGYYRKAMLALVTALFALNKMLHQHLSMEAKLTLLW